MLTGFFSLLFNSFTTLLTTNDSTETEVSRPRKYRPESQNLPILYNTSPPTACSTPSPPAANNPTKSPTMIFLQIDRRSCRDQHRSGRRAATRRRSCDGHNYFFSDEGFQCQQGMAFEIR
ncbi:hypothetical protein RHGRI_007901 [Rhododendron griersonianum]|uniref:Uncharacterized protein n=1 Tax=Rhododendron griersonianum TaxID=479676 RepID=A0AAV6KYN4_9ERIC|nr:hypothetical protein RHGRI_025059 [Rhododendron griersonianum]KAG5557812.1 hypothetical protein RHGRI_007901 [Rhododendron griersonianum]